MLLSERLHKLPGHWLAPLFLHLLRILNAPVVDLHVSDMSCFSCFLPPIPLIL